MMYAQLQLLSAGINDFEALRRQDCLYVDKTDLIFELTRKFQPVFLSRPRRFGKSLLVSTFESLFTHGTTYFKGLKIEKLWQERHAYKVLRLSFTQFSFDEENFKQNFLAYLIKRCKDCNIKISGDEKNATDVLYDMVREPVNGRIVLLIDEYDHPLIEYIDNQEAFLKIRQELRSFYLALKECCNDMRFIFITGVARFAQTTIFSGFNNLRDISLNSRFGTLLGFTEGELKRDFAPYLSALAAAIGCSQDAALEKLRWHYDGYSFDENVLTKVYNPWSVLMCLDDIDPYKPFKLWWSTTGGMSKFLYQYLDNEQHAHGTYKLLQRLIDPNYHYSSPLFIAKLQAADDLKHLDPQVLLVLTGYLTFKAKICADRVSIGFPNWEVRHYLENNLIESLASQRLAPAFRDSEAWKILAFALKNRESTKLRISLNRCLGIFPFSERKALDSEKGVTALLGLALRGLGFTVFREQEMLLGKSELIVEFPDPDSENEHRWSAIFEFKLLDDAMLSDDARKSRSSRLVAEAKTQLIDRRYFYQVPFNNEVVAFAGVLSKSKCELIAIEEVKISSGSQPA